MFSKESGVMVELSAPVVVAAVEAVLGEGPVWVAAEEALWWVDIKGPAIFRWKDGALDRFVPPLRVCSLAPTVGGGFIGGTERGFMRIDPVAGRYDPIGTPETDRPFNRFNDGKLDRAGRFWAGTMDDREQEPLGALYRVGKSLDWARIDDGYQVTNGPAFSPDGRTMYHNDSGRQVTYAFDLDADGEASNRRVLARYKEEDGYPDGMTVDAEGCLWIAFWDGWCLRRLSPEGEVLQVVEMPIERPTSCAFGGPEMNRLFVTSARIGLNASALAVQPSAGALFMLETSVRGLPDRPFG